MYITVITELEWLCLWSDSVKWYLIADASVTWYDDNVSVNDIDMITWTWYDMT